MKSWVHRNTIVGKGKIDSENFGSHIYLTEDREERSIDVVIDKGIGESTCTCSWGMNAYKNIIQNCVDQYTSRSNTALILTDKLFLKRRGIIFEAM